jgi:hypothetical protein
MYAFEWQTRQWSWMAHGNVFVQYLDDSGRRGRDQAGSINWLMVNARRSLLGGRLALTTMASVEPWTISGCGYPDLLALGKACEQGAIRDAQHPHDLFMELSARYDRPLSETLRWQAYGGFAGEPALGPVAFQHRPSAFANPLAPIGHHWLDSTHVSFGVVTAGVSSTRWKTEASVFNGREPDEERTDLDLGALDSFSGRLSFMAAPNVVLQLSAGHLTDGAGGHAHAGGAAQDLDRITASVLLHRRTGRSFWATTAGWGRNVELDGSTDSLLVESSVTLAERDTLFGRVEAGSRPPHAFNFHGAPGTYTVAKVQAGYVRHLPAWYGLQSGLGVSASYGVVPEVLAGIYDGRTNGGFGVFLTVRPAQSAAH